VLLSDTVSLLKDINDSSPYPSFPTNLFDVDGTVYFSGQDPTFGRELFASDGSAAGTRLVKDINPNGSSDPRPIAGANGVVYFVVNEGAGGGGLWRSDGTEAGTRFVAAIFPRDAAMVGDTLYFISANDNGLWKSDGTTQGTVRVIEGAAGPVAGAGGNAYFLRNDAATGSELWKTDGTAAGTSLVKDVRPGPTGSAPHNFVTANGLLYFIASGTGDTTQELYRTDGTPGGTVLLKSQVSYAFPIEDHVGPLADTVFFVPGPPSFQQLPNGGDDADLWKTDGTVAGTVKVKDFVSEPSRSPTQVLGWYDRGILLKGRSPTGEAGLWTSDGTEAGTVLLKPYFLEGLGEAAQANGKVYFSANDPQYGAELFTTDGTPEGTGLYADLLPGNFSPGPGYPALPADSGPRNLHPAANGVVFVAFSSYYDRFRGQNIDLFSTSSPSAVLLRPRGASTGNSTSSRYFFTSGDAAYFSAFNGREQRLYRSDGTPGGTAAVPDAPAGNIIDSSAT
jgi:ELWxxDGT repeat protein